MSLTAMSAIGHRHFCIVCPNCNKPEPVPVYKVKFDGRVFWVCRSCLKWFPRS